MWACNSLLYIRTGIDKDIYYTLVCSDEVRLNFWNDYVTQCAGRCQHIAFGAQRAVARGGGSIA